MSKLRENWRFKHMREEYTDLVRKLEHSTTEGKVRFDFIYHMLREIPLSDEADAEIRYYVVAKRIQVSVKDPPQENLWYVHSTRSLVGVTSRFLGVGIFHDADAFSYLEISPAVLKDLKENESSDVKLAQLKNVDQQVKQVNLRGSLTLSRRLKELEESGTYNGVAYLSRLCGKVIRVTALGSVSMMGRGVTSKQLEEYIESQILPRIHNDQAGRSS